MMDAGTRRKIGTTTSFLGELVNLSKTGAEKPIEGLDNDGGMMTFKLEKV